MRRILTASLGLALVTSAWAQHGGAVGHSGGGIAHPNAGFSSGRSFAAPAAPRVFGSTTGSRATLQSRPYSYQYNSPTGPAPFGGSYPYGERPHPAPGNGYRHYYSRGVYLVPGWLNYGYGYDYSGDYSPDYSDQPPYAPDPNAAANPENAGDQEAYAPAPPRQSYQPESPPSPAIQDQPQLTLLFKDGRTPQQVTNYAVTQTTLYVLDGARRREIPLDQIDLPQTVRTNREAGVDFEVPVAVD
jgi:hypothetical protein